MFICNSHTNILQEESEDSKSSNKASAKHFSQAKLLHRNYKLLYKITKYYPPVSCFKPHQAGRYLLIDVHLSSFLNDER